MRCRTVTMSPTTQNRTKFTVTGMVPGKKGLVPFKRTAYAQDHVQAKLRAGYLFAGVKDMVVKIEGKV